VTDGDIDRTRIASLEAAGLDRGRLMEHLRHADHNYYTAAYHLLAYRVRPMQFSRVPQMAVANS